MFKFIKQLSGWFLKPSNLGGELFDLSGKVVFITGASGRVANSVVKTLNKEGAKLILFSRNLPKLKQSLSQLESGSVLFTEGDVTNQKDVDEAVKQALERYGKIDVLINNAGVFLEKDLESVSLDEFNKVIDTNLKGVFIVSKAILAAMKKRRDGLIINIGSKISHNTNVAPGRVLYATSKYALEGFSFALNKELKKYGIRVCCLMPGTIATFPSLESKNFLHTDQIAKLISMIIKFEEIDFEGLIIKSKRQDI